MSAHLKTESNSFHLSVADHKQTFYDIQQSCYHSNFNYDFQLQFVVRLLAYLLLAGMVMMVSVGFFRFNSAKFSATDRMM